jgi:hypothetical protein
VRQLTAVLSSFVLAFYCDSCCSVLLSSASKSCRFSCTSLDCIIYWLPVGLRAGISFAAGVILVDSHGRFRLVGLDCSEDYVDITELRSLSSLELHRRALNFK